MRDTVALAAAGAAGALGRYWVSGLAYRLLGERFPYGTLLVNIAGSFLLGFVMQITLNSDLLPQALRVPLTVGFFGAFTTYSTFAYETIRYMEDASWMLAVLNICANLVLCLGAAWAGILAGRVLLGGVG